uniref:Uncharacterized protein n=1 Tax=Arundo donax TaxID=35708 RepID=A0A0A9EYH5_ARUDO
MSCDPFTCFDWNHLAKGHFFVRLLVFHSVSFLAKNAWVDVMRVCTMQGV